jgi:hypothetical protein
MRDAILKDFPGKEENLVNTIKSCFRDDKLTLQGILEERNRAGMALDITKKVNLGLLCIFIHEHGIEMARLQRSKQWNVNVFEDAVVIVMRDACQPVNALGKSRQTAVADAIRLLANSDIQFLKDYDDEDLRFKWQAGQIW